MENFDNTFSNLNEIYSRLDNIMGAVFNELQTDPTNKNKSNLLQELGDLSLKVISSQQQFAESYAPREYSEEIVSRLESKKEALTSALGQSSNMVR